MRQNERDWLAATIWTVMIAIVGLLLCEGVQATDFPVHGGGNIQTAINSAASAGVGSTITIDVQGSGGSFTPQILTLPVVTGCTTGQYVTIRTASFASLPNRRILPTDSALMPKITRTGLDAGGLFDLAPGTNGGCWKLQGLELTTDAVSQMVFALVNFQDTGSSHLYIDRCWIHSAEGSTGRTVPYNSSAGLGGVLSDGSDVTIINSYINGWWGLPLGASAGATMTQSSAIISDVGPCNTCTWTNNYLEGGYTHIQMGGSPQNATVGGTVSASPAPTTTSATISSVSSLSVGMPIALQVPWSSSYCKRDNTHPCWGNGVVQTIVGNAITFSALTGELPDGTPKSTAAPSSGGNAVWSGTQLSGITINLNEMVFNYAFEFWLRFTSGNGNHDKGYMEIKNGTTLDLEGNVFGEWGGWPSVFGMGNEENQVGDSPFATQSNITVKNNWIRGFTNCVYFGDSISGAYLGFLNTAASNIAITNNICEQPDTLSIDAAPATATVFNVGKSGYVHQHNTILTGYSNVYSGSVMTFDQSPAAAYGSLWTPNPAFADDLIGWGNYGVGCSAGALVNCLGSYTSSHLLIPLCTASACTSPANPVADGTFASSTAEPGWASILFTNAAAHIWSLTPSSPGYHAASDGTDIGVNWPNLCAAMSNDNPLPAGCGSSPPPTATLTVASSNPGSGCSFTNSPPDNGSISSGTTPTTLTFNTGTLVTVTYAATCGSNTSPTLVGYSSSTGNVGTVTISASVTGTAVYQGSAPIVPPGVVPLMVSAPAGSQVTLQPPDANGITSGSSFSLTQPSTLTFVPLPLIPPPPVSLSGSCQGPPATRKGQKTTCTWTATGTATQCSCVLH